MDNSNLSFFFMDESFCQKTKISALVGLMVPVRDYCGLRTRFYDVLRPFFRPEPNVLTDPPEIHGVELPGDTDEEKLRVVREIVDLVVSSNIEIYRVGYYITKTIRKTFKHDQEMLGTCWFSLQCMIQPRLSDRMIIPVMDGFDSRKVKLFSSPVRDGDVMRAAGHGDSHSVKHSENILGEVFYADSQHSAFIQIVDIVAYLRKVIDWQNEGHSLPSFKQKLSLLAKKLDAVVAEEEIIALTFNGKIHGPAYRAKQPGGSASPITTMATIKPSED